MCLKHVKACRRLSIFFPFSLSLTKRRSPEGGFMNLTSTLGAASGWMPWQGEGRSYLLLITIGVSGL